MISRRRIPAIALLSIPLILAVRPQSVRANAGAWNSNGVPVAPGDSAQIKQCVVPDGSGGAIVAWEDKRSGRYLAYAQHLDLGGSIMPGWPGAGVLLPNRGLSQGNLTACPDQAGGAFIASDDSTYKGVVLVHHLGADGVPAIGWPSTPVTLQRAGYGQDGGTQGAFLPALLVDDSGGVIVARTYRDRLHQSITLVRLTSSASLAAPWDSGVFAGTGSPWEYPSVLCADGQRGVFVIFQEDWIPARIFIERFDGSGSLAFAPVPVSAAALAETAPGLVGDGGTGAIAVWEDHRNGSFDQVFAQHILADGSVAPGWPADGLAVCAFPTAPGFLSDFVFPGPLSSVTSDGAGGVYVAWSDYRDGTGLGDIYAQHVLGDGTIAVGWPANGLAICTAPDDQQRPSIAADGAGGVVIAWQDRRSGSDADIYAQHVLGNATLADGWSADGLPACAATGDQLAPAVATDAAGNAFMAWSDARSGIPNVYATKIAAGQTPAAVPPSTPARLALAGASPNPTFGPGLTVRFTLATAERATLEVLDVGGRRVARREIGPLGPGSHVLELQESAVLPAGVYIVRLVQSGQVVTARASLIR